MSVNDVLKTYMSLRKSLSVADAASETIVRLTITPLLLVDAFNAAQLDSSFSNEEAETFRNHRNELLSHFSSLR